jgi:hypothetical protein
MGSQSTLRNAKSNHKGQAKKQVWTPSISFFKTEGKDNKNDDKSLPDKRSYKLKLRPHREDDDATYTVYIQPFEYQSQKRDPEVWCTWRTAIDGLRKTMNVSEEDTEELQKLFYSNLGPQAQADWQRFANARLTPEALAALELEDLTLSDPTDDAESNSTQSGKIPKKTKKKVVEPKVAEEDSSSSSSSSSSSDSEEASGDGEPTEKKETTKQPTKRSQLGRIPKKPKKKAVDPMVAEKDNRRRRVALDLVLNDMAMKIFPDGERSARLQKKYLCNMGLSMNGMEVTAFARRLQQLSSYLPYFPMRLVGGKLKKPEMIGEEQLVEALDMAIQPERPQKTSPVSTRQ